MKAKPIPLRARQAVWKRSGGRCECGCGQVARMVHHRKLRSQGGGHDPANLMHLAPECHDRIHANPEAAYARGLLLRSWQNPETVPIVPAGVW